MSNSEKLEQQKLDTREIISALIDDGSDPDALYEIEHHFSADRLEDTEPAMLAAFKLGYEVYETEEMELEDGTTVYCFDITRETPLIAESIDEQVSQLMTLAEEYNIEYDGWGTYFESDEEYEDLEDDELEQD